MCVWRGEGVCLFGEGQGQQAPVAPCSRKKATGFSAVGLQQPSLKVDSEAQLKSKMFIGVLYKKFQSENVYYKALEGGGKTHTFGMHLKNQDLSEMKDPPQFWKPTPPCAGVLQGWRAAGRTRPPRVALPAWRSESRLGVRM